MFRDVYKKANEDIKGDRAILDRAFLQAAQPVKRKSPIIKYSFVGTAVAAVILIGAVFANPSVFTEKTKDIKPYEDAATPTEYNNAVTFTDDDVDEAVQTEDEITRDDRKQVAVKNTEDINESVIVDAPAVSDKSSEQSVDTAVAAEVEPDVVDNEDYGIAVMSIEDEPAKESQPDEGVGTFSLGKRKIEEEPTFDTVSDETEEIAETVASGGGSVPQVATETTSEPEGDEAVEMFSYMYDVSCYGDGAVTEGFVNTDISPVTNREEAIERAKNECNVEYDIVAVYRDSIEDIWKVSFSMTNMLGGNQDVYMNSVGITQMIVYGK